MYPIQNQDLFLRIDNVPVLLIGGICTPIPEQIEMKNKGIEELVNSTYFKGIVGSLCYLTSIIPNIVYGVGTIGRFTEKPYKSHLQATKRILRYISDTHDHRIFYSYSSYVNLVGYIDYD